MPRKKAPTPLLRPDGRRVQIENSGLEVWLYDDGESERLEATGAFAFGSEREATSGGFEPLIARGDLVAYSLYQDDMLDVEVHVGKAFTKAELAKGMWLEPQTAWLKLPSGKLALESNDALRLQDDTPGAKGAILDVPPGNYKVTLYRVDHEALDRAEREWTGPQEVVLLTKGGTVKDAAQELLPFVPIRDLSWVGKYEIKGKKAKVLAWFHDRWDTFVVNLDDAGAKKLGLAAGSVIRLAVPDAELTLHATFGESWLAAQQFPAPKGIPLDEYGVCAIQGMGDWDGARCLFGRREKAAKRVEDPRINIWMDATLELVDQVEKRGPPTGARQFVPTTLAEKPYYEEGFIMNVLSDVVPAVDDDEDTDLFTLLLLIDDRFKKFDLRPVGEYDWIEPGKYEGMERSVRLWTGRYDSFAILFASPGRFELVLATEYSHGRWRLTGFADELEGYLLRGQTDKELRERVRVENLDQEIGTFFPAHDETLMNMEPGMVPSPKDEAAALAALGRLLDQLTVTGATARG